jgi:thiamine biosynthesis lipoprotein
LFDTEFAVVGYAGSKTEFNRLAEHLETRLAELHRMFDIYHGYDGLNNLHTVNENAGAAPVAVPSEVLGLLTFAKEGFQLSGGTVDVTLGPVLQIWREYRAGGTSLPSADELRAASGLRGIENLVIDPGVGTVFLERAGMSLDVGAIGKGYAAALAVKEAVEAGFTGFLLNAGGSVTTAGAPPGERGGWRIGVQDPGPYEDGRQATLDVVTGSDFTVSCSGDYRRTYTVDGVRYHHIIDPETLMPAAGFTQVTVLHPDAGIADLLSTAFFILPYEEGLSLAKGQGAEAMWLRPDGIMSATDGYKALSELYGADSEGANG